MDLSFSKSVAEAIASNHPVVALESTIISHGMPWPQNLETALAVEEEVKRKGAVPATIAVIDGVPCIGLDRKQLQQLAQAEGVMKLSRRDMAFAISENKTGATTVAATMILAEKAGIRLFATGGIGGVHRDVQDSWDISADLTELAKTNVAVVCAGVKSILDIPRTLEYLETMGVPVVGYGTDEFPAFYTRTSGCGVDFRMDNPEAVARFLKTKWDMNLQGGVVIANPIPEAFVINPEEINTVITKALNDAESQNIRGKAITPFLLSKISELTGGNSLASNIELVKNNAKLAGEIAVEHQRIN